MKKLLTFLLTIAMAVCLIACDSRDSIGRDAQDSAKDDTQSIVSSGEVDVTIQTINGVEISLDAINWQTKITADDFDAVIEGKNLLKDNGLITQYPINAMAPVSSAGDVVDGKLNIFTGGYTEDGLLYSNKVEEQHGYDGDFIAFDLFFKSDFNQDIFLMVGDLLSRVDSTGSPDCSALRVGFIPMGTATQGEDPYELTPAIETALIWEPNSTAHFIEESSEKLEYSGFCTSFDGLSENELSDNEVKPVTTFDEDHLIISLQKGISKVRVYIWTEGQDVDCVNQLSFFNHFLTLTFSGK